VRFLLYGQLGDTVAEALAEHGHRGVAPGDLGLAEAEAARVAQACREKQYELMTGSRSFLDAILPGSGNSATFGRVIVFLQDRREDHELAIHRLFDRYKRLKSGRLYTVTGGRVKVRQLPAGPIPSNPVKPVIN
jgi:hypothetical protein